MTERSSWGQKGMEWEVCIPASTQQEWDPVSFPTHKIILAAWPETTTMKFSLKRELAKGWKDIWVLPQLYEES